MQNKMINFLGAMVIVAATLLGVVIGKTLQDCSEVDTPNITVVCPEPNVSNNITLPAPSIQQYQSRYEDKEWLVDGIIRAKALEGERYRWTIDRSNVEYVGDGVWDCYVTFTNHLNWKCVFDEEEGIYAR
jgi:hypothetical protein